MDDLDTMRTTANGVLSAETLPRYADLVAVSNSLRGYLGALVDTAEKHLPALPDRGYAETRIAEARYRMCMGPGNGLQSAHDVARGMAEVVADLADLCQEINDTNEERPRGH